MSGRQGYGVPLQVGVTKLGPYELRLEYVDRTMFRYSRLGLGGDEESAFVDAGIRLVPLPMYPVFKPGFVTRHIMVRLAEPVLLRPEGRRVIYLEMKVDVALYAVSGGAKSMFDVLQLDDKPKLVLYGPPESGVVAREVRSPVYVSEPRPSLGKAVVKAVLSNVGGSHLRITRILLDAAPLRLFYRFGSWASYTQEIEVQAERFRATVLYRQSFKRGLQELEDPPEVKPPRFFQKTEMPWGV
ncbi:MAG: DUF432 domain-containing protein [Aeropyrum sp.]|nr:DUF432 domain-containing protein [Aeropyrum sp.]